MANYILHELVYNARLFMKMASWGFCVLVFESSTWGALRPVRRLLALRLLLPWKFRQVCSISVLYFGKFATIP